MIFLFFSLFLRDVSKYSQASACLKAPRWVSYTVRIKTIARSRPMATLMSNFSKLLAWIHWTLIPFSNSVLFWFLWDDTLLVPYSSMTVPSLSYFLCHCLCFVFPTYMTSALFFSLYGHKVQGYVGGCVKGHLFWRAWTLECNPCKSRVFILLTATAGGPRIV